MEILFLNEKDIKEVLTMKDSIKLIKEILKLDPKTQASIPLRTNIDVPKENGQSLYMPGLVASKDALGIKIVSVYGDNYKLGLDSISSLMIMQDQKTGQVNALMDGNYLTKLRTGALVGAATDILARKEASIFALIGTGGQARTQLEAVLNVRDIKEVRVSARDKEKAENFIQEMKRDFSKDFDFQIFLAENSDEAIRDADIITAVTTAENPVFNGDLVKEGAHVNGVGSYTPDMQEIPSSLLTRADKIYVDTLDGVLNESGDFIIGMEESNFSRSDINGEIGKILLGELTAREDGREISFFKTVGSGIFDIVTGKHIYDLAIKNNIGSKIKF